MASTAFCSPEGTIWARAVAAISTRESTANTRKISSDVRFTHSDPEPMMHLPWKISSGDSSVLLNTALSHPSARTCAQKPPTATTTPIAAETPTPRWTIEPKANARTAAGTPSTRAERAMARSGEGSLLLVSAISHHDEVHASDRADDQPDREEHGVKAGQPIDEEPD